MNAAMAGRLTTIFVIVFTLFYLGGRIAVKLLEKRREDASMTQVAIAIAVLLVGGLLATAIFAVNGEARASDQAERDAIARRIKRLQMTDGAVLHLRRGARIP